MSGFRSTLGIGIRAFIYITVGIGALVVMVPALITDLTPGKLFFLGLLISIIGAAIYLWTTWDFIILGHGTPLPLDPPRSLVVHGLYKVVRNLMALGFILILIGEAISFGSMEILIYAAVLFIAIHLFIVFVEEPDLKNRFGEPYDQYCKSVHRWLPSLRK